MRRVSPFNKRFPSKQVLSIQRRFRSSIFDTSDVTGSQLQVDFLKGEDEGIAVFTMNRPEARNALGKQMMKEFSDALERVRFDPAVRVVILQSVVPKGQ